MRINVKTLKIQIIIKISPEYSQIIGRSFMQIDSIAISPENERLGSQKRGIPCGRYSVGYLRLPRDFACEYFQIREYAKSSQCRGDFHGGQGGTGGGDKPVYNKAQYPRISLSCIFNDFLGDFGRSPAFRGRKKPEREPVEKLESLKPNYSAAFGFCHCSPTSTIIDINRKLIHCL